MVRNKNLEEDYGVQGITPKPARQRGVFSLVYDPSDPIFLSRTHLVKIGGRKISYEFRSLHQTSGSPENGLEFDPTLPPTSSIYVESRYLADMPTARDELGRWNLSLGEESLNDEDRGKLVEFLDSEYPGIEVKFI